MNIVWNSIIFLKFMNIICSPAATARSGATVEGSTPIADQSVNPEVLFLSCRWSININFCTNFAAISFLRFDLYDIDLIRLCSLRF